LEIFRVRSPATSHKTMPILQNLNQVTVRVTNHPGPLIAQPKRAQAPTKTQTNQGLRYIPLKAETNLPCVGSRFTSWGKEFHALQPRTTNDWLIASVRIYLFWDNFLLKVDNLTNFYKNQINTQYLIFNWNNFICDTSILQYWYTHEPQAKLGNRVKFFLVTFDAIYLRIDCL
jgi:hypothetical protein